MGTFFKAFKRAAKAIIDYSSSDVFSVNGKEFVCTHCGNYHFESGSAQLNTAAMSFVGLDWADKSAYILSCKECGQIFWFKYRPSRIDGNGTIE